MQNVRSDSGSFAMSDILVTFNRSAVGAEAAKA